MEEFGIEENEDSSDDILESPTVHSLRVPFPFTELLEFITLRLDVLHEEFLSKADSGDYYLAFASHMKRVKEESNYQDPVV
ncbi:hypothetical protein BDZ91DRAFT_755048, partial [Kalaharituber pfeilii]